MELPTLRYYVTKKPPSGASLVLITHITDTAVPFVENLSEALDVRAVIAIPYSTRQRALRRMRSTTRVYTPAELDELGTLALSELRTASGENPVVLQEIGGYCAPHVSDLAETPGVVGVVEDTRQGHWRYARAAPLALPVLSIAESPLKSLEDRQVGRAIAFALDRVYRENFFRILGESIVGMLGYGAIGAATAAALRALGATVMVHDIDPLRCARAVIDGFIVPGREETLGRADVIVGTSGCRSLTAGDLHLLRDGVVLASGSSKRVEFDVDGITQRAEEIEAGEEVARYTIDGRTAYLVNQGMPVNFRDQSVLGCVLDLVYTELFLCMQQLVEGPPSPGLHALDPATQGELADTWREIHYRRRQPDGLRALVAA